jgi:long-subunit fatty acid transport protein
MVGYSKDGNAIPDKAVSFESPDYNSNTYSAGFDYELDKQSSFGFGYLYSKKDDRTTSNTNPDGTPYINGTISGVTAHLISVAYRSSF